MTAFIKQLRGILPRNPIFLAWLGLLLIAVVLGLIAASQVFFRGLVVTNLTNQVPWGLWIAVDLSAIALSGGAFFLSALVHILGLKRFRPLARLAVFIGLLGYSTALGMLLLDIGRPDRFWHGWVFWNTHSMLWEVTMCITLYFNVLALEVFPMIVGLPFFGRWPKVRALAERLHHYAPVLAYLGLFFSALHQSSLGATYGVLIARPIWFRPTMPLLFIASAIAAGPSLAIAISLLVSWLRGYDLVPRDVLFDAARITGIVLVIYLYMRFWDFWAGAYGYVPLRTEATQTLLSGSLAMNFWSWEIVLGALIPAIVMLWAASARSEAGLFVGGSMAAIGLIMNRWNTIMVGQLTPLTTDPAITYPLTPTYAPNWIEWAAALGVVGGMALLFSLGMYYLPDFGRHSAKLEHAH